MSGGTPTFTLNNGGTAVYDAAATAALGDPTKMVFSYTVAASDPPANGLAIVRGDQNGAVIVDAAGHNPDFTAAFTSFPAIQLPSGAAVVSMVASSANGVEHAGDTLTFTIGMDRAVTVSGGTPTLKLSNNGTATYDAAATAALGDPTKLVFSYAVTASDKSVNGLYVTFGSRNGAAILDASGLASDFSGASANFPGIQIDAFPSVTVTSLVASPASGTEHGGDTIVFTMTMSGSVTVSGGTPTLTLSNGGTAAYDAAATAALGDPAKLVFSYTVGTANLPANGLSIVRGDQNGAIVQDTAGHTPNFSGAFTNFPDIAIALPPTAVMSMVASAPRPIEFAGGTVTLTMTMNRAVTVTGGTPTLTLNNGGTATYDAAATAALSDPTKLVFKYTISASDLSAPQGLAVVRGDTNGANILDASGQGPDFSGAFTNFPSVEVSTPATTITSFVASPSSGTELPGDVITLTMTMSRAVTVTGGAPTLTLNDGGIATYDAAATSALSDPTKLVFKYTVSADYDAHNVDSLAVVGGAQNGAVIVDGNGKGPDFSAMTTPFASLAVKVGIDLASIAFGPITTLGYAANQDNSGGLLTVSDGTHSSAITLLGQYAAADFHASSDFHGGTLITDPALTGAAAATFLASSHT